MSRHRMTATQRRHAAQGSAARGRASHLPPVREARVSGRVVRPAPSWAAGSPPLEAAPSGLSELGMAGSKCSSSVSTEERRSSDERGTDGSKGGGEEVSSYDDDGERSRE